MKQITFLHISVPSLEIVFLIIRGSTLLLLYNHQRIPDCCPQVVVGILQMIDHPKKGSSAALTIFVPDSFACHKTKSTSPLLFTLRPMVNGSLLFNPSQACLFPEPAVARTTDLQ
jgi:hypothetical protein